MPLRVIGHIDRLARYQTEDQREEGRSSRLREEETPDKDKKNKSERLAERREKKERIWLKVIKVTGNRNGK